MPPERIVSRFRRTPPPTPPTPSSPTPSRSPVRLASVPQTLMSPKWIVARSRRTPPPASLSLLFELFPSRHAHRYVPCPSANDLMLTHSCTPVRHCPSTSGAYPLPAFNINQRAHQEQTLNMRPSGPPPSLCPPRSPAQLQRQQTHAHGFGPWLLSNPFCCAVPDGCPTALFPSSPLSQWSEWVSAPCLFIFLSLS